MGAVTYTPRNGLGVVAPHITEELVSKLTITIDGYGTVKVRRPKPLNRDSFDDAVAEAVAKTMQLVTNPSRGFHPALGRIEGRK